jgi:[ribosomal protein S18]-alanine N-acetyltransferase
MQYQFQPMTEVNARAILAWRYDGPYARYDAAPKDVAQDLAVFLDADNFYQSVHDDGGVVIAYRCFGVVAQVPGGDYTADALDTGGGLRPDLTGSGMGLGVLLAGLDFAKGHYHPSACRVTIAEFNIRAQKVCQKAGFSVMQRFTRAETNEPFLVFLKSDLNR